MKKIYNPSDIEQPIYKYWCEHNCFKYNSNSQQKSYCIMIPPPNITGSLHMGHAFQQTIIDILIRYHRMQGKNTLLQYGTDHAGIATQIIMEHKIANEEGKSKHDYNRDAFIEKIWQWKIKLSNMISNQMRRLGISADWDRERFTMDKELSNAVKRVFIQLYKENLIYRGKKIVNWDTKLRTAISDLEIENREIKGYIWYLRYPLADGFLTKNGLNYITVATTRPETIFGDTGIAVNKNDPRYCNLIGQFAILPLTGRLIPIIGDDYADIYKETGCVKITPAHDFNDYEVGKRHKLKMINIFDFDGCIRKKVEVFDYNGKFIDKHNINIPKIFHGQDSITARSTVISEIKRLGLLVNYKHHNLIAPYGDRSGTIIEPMLTNQWYIRIGSLAKLAIEVVKQGKIKFIPKKYENIYFSWMNNIQDWCISRQLWWGHRIPAWYDVKGKIYVELNETTIRQKYKLSDDYILFQDNDVLDTWLSSSIWTFATLGWPNDTVLLKTFHPTNVIVSGFDIIFFWIARMIMLTTHFIKDNNKPQVPFNTVYITGLIRDEEGQKMSKSKGNVIDPLDIIDGISLTDLLQKRTDNMMQPKLAKEIYDRTKKQFPNGIEPHGTDALRFTLAALASTGRNINWDMRRLRGYRNFCNKLWNASRFVILNTKNQNFNINSVDKILLSLADRWILAEFNQIIKIFRESLDNYRFDLATEIIHEFICNKFCDWYLEATKSVINYGSIINKYSANYTLITVLEAILRLVHPLMPFITETIWQKIKIISNIQGETIMLQPFPIYNQSYIDNNAISDWKWIQEIIVAIRSIRNEIHIPQKKQITISLRNVTPKLICLVKQNTNFICHLAYLDKINILPTSYKGPIAFTKLIENAEILIPIENLFNKQFELTRLTKELENINDKIDHLVNKLNNEKFVNLAPRQLVLKEQEKLKKYQQNKIKLLEQQKIILDT